MQPLREFQIVYLVMTSPSEPNSANPSSRSAWRWCAALAFRRSLLTAARATSQLTPPRTPRHRNPQPKSWLQAFLWIRDNTPKDALFALDADYINAPAKTPNVFAPSPNAPPCRLLQGRREASIAPDLTAAWTLAQSAQRNLSAHHHRRRAPRALSPLGVSWLVLQSTAPPTSTALPQPTVTGLRLR